ncbi:YiiD C-terminal domain-containing protein [Hyphobacterium sp. CCMP332]|nr:YiiD C-terminal domain-containing protein [Hyphobacterium sp. CCMP332]
MKLKPWAARWFMNLYPPNLLNRIVISKLSDDFREVDIKIKKSILNKNLQGSIFGGTLYSAADPYPALLYWQCLHQQDINTEAWLKKAEVEYHKPASTSILFKYKISEKEISEAMEELFKDGKFSRWHTVEGKDQSGDTCISIKSLIVLKLRKSK